MSLLDALSRLLGDTPVSRAAGPECGCGEQAGVNPVTGLCVECELGAHRRRFDAIETPGPDDLRGGFLLSDLAGRVPRAR